VASGASAWAPEELLTISGTEAVALVDYESTELNTEGGESVRVLFEMLAWAWVKNSAGREGWVPLETLQAKP
jgi:SH3-like domain-containing protein